MNTLLQSGAAGVVVMLLLLIVGRATALLAPLSTRRLPGVVDWRWKPAILTSAALGLFAAALGAVSVAEKPSTFLLVAAWICAAAAPWVIEVFWWSYLGPDVARRNAATSWQLRFLRATPLYGLSIAAIGWALQLAAVGR